MAKNSCWPVCGIPQRPQFASGHRVRYRERVAPHHVDVLVQQWRQPGHVGVIDGVALGTQLRQGRLHVGGVPQHDHVEHEPECAQLILLPLAIALPQFATSGMEDRSGDRMTALAPVELGYAGVQVDPRYRWRNDTLIQRFGITPDEERQLATIVSRVEAARRHAEREVQRRQEAGAVTRAEYLSASDDKRVSARLMRAKGMTQTAIAKELGVMDRTVRNWLKD